MSIAPNRIRLASRIFLVLIPLIAALALAGVILFWGFGVERLGNDALGRNFIVLFEDAPLPERRLYGLLASLPVLFFWFYASWHLFAMFRNFLAGQFVGLETVRRLRAYAVYSALAVLSAFVLSGVMRWAMGYFDDAPLWTHLGFSVTHAAMLFSSAIIYVASHIVEQGYAYKKETEDYV